MRLQYVEIDRVYIMNNFRVSVVIPFFAPANKGSVV